MSEAAIGALVQYCGHDGMFLADIFKIKGVNVVRASQPVTGDNLIRGLANSEHMLEEATHWITDFPEAGFWRPDLGVFVVPEEQVTKLKGEKI